MPTVINLNKDDFQSKTILDISGIAPSICAGEGGNKLKVVYPMVLKMGCKGETYDERSEAPPLDSADSKHPVVVCYGISAYESNAMKSKNPHSGIYEAKTARTLDTSGGNPACNQGGVLIVTYAPMANFCAGYGETQTSATLETGYHYGSGGDAALILKRNVP